MNVKGMIVAFGVLVGAAVVAVSGAGSRAQGGVVFFDDFDAPALNRDVWNVVVSGRTANNEQQAYVDSPETMALVRGDEAQGATNGALRITARHRPGFRTAEGRAFDFTSGRIDTRGKVSVTFGTVSARIRMTAGAGLWPAFWVLGDGRWPETGEMDVMENVGAPDWVNSALHGPGYSGNTPFAKRRPFPAGQDSTGWHVYAMDWSTDGFAFKVDDEVYYRVSRAAVEARGRWVYDTPKHLIVNFALGGQYPQAVNKITEPYPGLAASSVDVIRADKAIYLVDWVRVTRP